MGYYYVTLKSHKGCPFCFRLPLIWVTYTCKPPCENILFKVTCSHKVFIQGVSEIYSLDYYVSGGIIIIVIMILLLG